MLANKVALITGSSRGIGKAIAFRLAQEKCNIIVAAKSEEENPNLPGTIYSTAEEIRSKHDVSVLSHVLDLRSKESIKELVRSSILKFNKIDFLINNASALNWKSITTTKDKDYQLIYKINNRGTFLLTKLCLNHMILNKFGHIIMHSPHYTPLI